MSFSFLFLAAELLEYYRPSTEAETVLRERDHDHHYHSWAEDGAEGGGSTGAALFAISLMSALRHRTIP